MKPSNLFYLCVIASIALAFLDVVLLLTDTIGVVWFVVLLIVLLVIPFLPILTFKGTRVEFLDDSLQVQAPFVDVTVPYSTMDSVTLVRDFDFGLKTWGYGGIRRASGTFTNRSLGTYTLAADSSVKDVIVIRYDKGPLAFNLGTQEETERAYERLRGLEDGSTTDPQPVVSAPGSHRRNIRTIVAISSVTLIATLAIVILAFNSGHVDVTLEGDRLRVDAVMVDEDIPLDDITGIELREDLGYGSRVGGLSSSGYLSGNFSNDEFGRYVLAVHRGVDVCIVVHTTGGTVVFNLGTAEETVSLFEELEDRLAQTWAYDAVPANSLYAVDHMAPA